MIPLGSFIVVLCALASLGAACFAIGEACFSRQNDSVSPRIALFWAAVCATLVIALPSLDNFQASPIAAVASAATLLAAFCGSFFLSRRWRETAMQREAARLYRTASSELADPASTEPDYEALCAKAARTYDLTRREEDVLRLLIEGRTAPQIAEELVVSPNTVKTHVRNLYRKLGINRRADLACRLGASG